MDKVSKERKKYCLISCNMRVNVARYLPEELSSGKTHAWEINVFIL